MVVSYSPIVVIGGSVIEEADGKKVLRPYNPNEINKSDPDEENQPKHSLVTASIMAQQEAMGGRQ